MTLRKLRRFRIVRLGRLIYYRCGLGFHNWQQMLGFLFGLVPVINWFFGVWCNGIARRNSNSVDSRDLFFKILDSGIGWGGVRHIRPEVRTIIARRYFQSHPNITLNDLLVNHDDDYKDILNNLRELGYASLGIVFSKEAVDDAINYFSKQEYFEGQVPVQGDLKPRQGFLDYGTKEDEERYRSILPSVSFECQQVNNFIQSQLKQSIEEIYLGFKSTTYSINTFSTIPSSADHHVLHLHRDYDHFHALAFFIAWTGTAADDGATFYVPCSHRLSRDRQEVVALEARVGEVFAIDVFGIHSGNANLKKQRLVTWIRSGTTPNYAWLLNGDDKLMPYDMGRRCLTQ